MTMTHDTHQHLAQDLYESHPQQQINEAIKRLEKPLQKIAKHIKKLSVPMPSEKGLRITLQVFKDKLTDYAALFHKITVSEAADLTLKAQTQEDRRDRIEYSYGLLRELLSDISAIINNCKL